MTTTQAHALAVLVEEEIAQLIRFRRWHRTRSAILRPYFADMETRDRAALRTLLRLRRVARNTAREAEVARSAAEDAGVDAAIAQWYRTAGAFPR